MTNSVNLNLDYFNALQLDYAINQRIVSLVTEHNHDVQSNEVQALYDIKYILEDFINAFVEQHEANIAERESQILDDESAVERFLNEDPKDNS